MKKMKAYIVITDWAIRGENGTDVSDVFTDEQEARKCLQKTMEEERRNAENLGFDVSEITSEGVELYEDGYYAENHISVAIRELELNISSECEREIARGWDESCHMEDFLSELADADEGSNKIVDDCLKVFGGLTDEQRSELLRQYNFNERFEKYLGNADTYWDIYWDTVWFVMQEIAGQIEQEKAPALGKETDSEQ